MQTEHSTNTAEVEIDGVKYCITLLNTQATFKLQFLLGNQVKFAMGDKGVDPELMWSLAEKLLKFAEANNVPLDIEKHFFGKVETLDRVVLEALKLNLPGFTKQLNVLIANSIRKISESVKKQSDLMTSGQATPESDKQFSQ